MKKLNQLERLGIAHKVTDIIIRYVELHQEEWWSVRNDVSERAEAFKDGSVEELADYLICDWCDYNGYILSSLASEWARQQVISWDLQQCIDYIGGKVDFIERSNEDVRLMSYRSKAWLMFREQTNDIWKEDPQAYAHIWEPMTPYNMVRKEVIEILNNVSA